MRNVWKWVALGACCVPLTALAQSPDEQLLSAQMAFQQANGQKAQLDDRVKRATEAKARAEQRLLDAQNAMQQANNEFNAAAAAQASAQQILQQATTALNDAWKRKDGGQ
ncbi:hypothetical protein [uncultured Aquitalea sp.]|uniref:hypothetical protein n=1 Tax=uncultured Aquitalea sp. TaxID=540272 RepID=UPI0025F93677|nr:hypothetical protein [uncultured Aquitalea sp.]